MRFKRKITKEVVTIKSGDQDHVWYVKEGDKTLLLLPADQFFAEYESMTDKKRKDSK